MSKGEVVWITEPVEFEILGDRVVATVTSGTRQRRFSIAPHMVRHAVFAAARALEELEREHRVVLLRPVRTKAGDAH